MGDTIASDAVDAAAEDAAPMISVRGVGVRFNLQSRHRSIRDLLFKGSRGGATSTFQALKNISFDVHAGEAIGVVGRNGSGKSTLLKIVAGVMLPDTGSVTLGGGVAPLIEITGGFVPDLTARDNIYLAAGLHGMKHDAVDEIFDDIVDFAEIRTFLDTPFKHLSSGMRVRLAFSVVSRLNEPILIVDEVLAVGDQVFKEKCYERITEMLDEGRTLFFVSHSDGLLKRFCQRGVYLTGGAIKHDGPIEEVLDTYRVDTRAEARSDTRADGAPGQSGKQRGRSGKQRGRSGKQPGQPDNQPGRPGPATVPDGDDDPSAGFRDVDPDNPYVDDIRWFKDRGLARGGRKGNFRPSESVSRQALAVILFRFRHGANARFVTEAAPFDDVPAASVFAGPITWAAQAGILDQADGNTFGPTEPVTRQELVRALSRLSEVPAESSYAPAIAWLKQQGAGVDDDDDNVRLAEPVTRQELARFVHVVAEGMS